MRASVDARSGREDSAASRPTNTQHVHHYTHLGSDLICQLLSCRRQRAWVQQQSPPRPLTAVQGAGTFALRTLVSSGEKMWTGEVGVTVGWHRILPANSSLI